MDLDNVGSLMDKRNIIRVRHCIEKLSIQIR